MRSISLLGALALALVVPATAQEVHEGVMTISYGYFVDANGNRVSLVGKKLPFVAERIQLHGNPRHGAYVGTDSLVYRNDHGDLSYVVSGLPMPSALDDVRMSSGAGAIWQTMTMGINANITNQFEIIMMRWSGYRNYVPGLGPNVSAFTDMVLDFGGAFTFAGYEVPGKYKITFNVSGLNLSFPQDQMYFSQQFRTWDGGNPNAPFRMEFDSVFSIGFPSPGQSAETFFFDQEPNGIYDEEEIDIWPPGSEANLLLAIDANQTGTIDTRLPASFTISPGTPMGGSLSDLWDSDNLYVAAGAGIVLVPTQHPLRMVITSTAVSTNATRVALELESKATSGSIQQLVEFWNYQTNSWELGDIRQMSTSDLTLEIVATGNPTHYIHQTTREVRARMSCRPTSPLLAFPWRASWDRAVWKITRP